MTQTPPNNPVTLGHFRASTGYTAADTQINVTLRPKDDTAQDFPATMIAYDRAVGILDLIVDLPEGVSIVRCNETDAERCRTEGIDAHLAGKDRSANPYSWEASRAWDSGWMQAAHAQVDTAPIDKAVKFVFAEDENGEPTTDQIACAVQADPADVAHLLAQPVGLDGRSAWTWLRLKDGTLMLVTYPSGDTYVELSDKGVCDWVWQGESEQKVEPVRYVVDGHITEDPDSDLDGYGQFAPFRIFVPDRQDYLPGTYATREEAQTVADMFNKAFPLKGDEPEHG